MDLMMPPRASAASISPPVSRVIAVLDFLTGHPEQAFTLSEIAKSLRISSATCHNLLSVLAKAGYVYRTTGKTFVLGPALVRVGRASLTPGLMMQVARPEMRVLADHYDVICTASHMNGDEVEIIERAAALSHLGWNSADTPVPVAAPLGGLFKAWRNAEMEQWITGANPSMTMEAEARFRESMVFLRTHGFTFGVRTVALSDPALAQELRNSREFTDHMLTAIEPRSLYQLAYVAAPVFSVPGEVIFCLSLAGFVAPVKGDAIAAMGQSLRAACDRIGMFAAGRSFT